MHLRNMCMRKGSLINQKPVKVKVAEAVIVETVKTKKNTEAASGKKRHRTAVKDY